MGKDKRRLEIDQTLVELVMSRDPDHPSKLRPFRAYIELDTGQVIQVREDRAKMSRKLRSQFKLTPERFLELSGLTHDEHHELLQSFLETQSEDVRNLYDHSVGMWKENVSDDTLDALEALRWDAIRKLVTAKLDALGIEPVWK